MLLGGHENAVGALVVDDIAHIELAPAPDPSTWQEFASGLLRSVNILQVVVDKSSSLIDRPEGQ